jgi:hypothetical protein
LYKEGRIRAVSLYHCNLTSISSSLISKAKTLLKEFIMSALKTDTTGAEHHEAVDVHRVPTIDEKYATGKVVEVQAASVALAAALAAQKPKLFSKNMLKLYFIMSVGYLISTMNGFGKFPSLLIALLD